MDTTNPTLKDKRILITGGKGYLGSRLAETLRKAKADVYILDNKAIPSEKEFAVDLTIEPEVERVIKIIRPQVIFHLAATLNRERDFVCHDKTMLINYQGTMNLLFALKNTDYENFIFTSTSEVYGGNTPPFNENMLPEPASPYSMSKYYAEVGIQTFSKIFSKNYTILRLFNFVGKDMPDGFFIPQLLSALRTNKNFQMTKGEQKRDMLYVDDVINALLLCISNPNTDREIFNVCSGKSLSLRELADIFKNSMKSNSCIEYGVVPYRENEIWDMSGSNDKIFRKLGFYPKYNLFEELIK